MKPRQIEYPLKLTQRVLFVVIAMEISWIQALDRGPIRHAAKELDATPKVHCVNCVDDKVSSRAEYALQLSEERARGMR